MDMMKLITKYEAKTGETVDEVVRGIMEAFNEIGKQFTEQGREDAANSRPARPANEFVRLGFQTLDDEDGALDIAAVMQLCYMEGYKAVSESSSEIPS